MSKQQQCSDWSVEELKEEQVEYAASDVLYLHKIRKILIERLKKEKRLELAYKCFDFLPSRVELDRKGWKESDIFHH